MMRTRARRRCAARQPAAVWQPCAAQPLGSITDKRGFYGDMEQAKLSFTAKEEKPRLAMRM